MPQARDTHPLMKGRKQSTAQDWFRIENAHKDEESASDALTRVYIYGDIGESWWGDGTSANDFVKLLSGIKSSTIELHLNSGGGSAFDGIAIYQALVAHEAEIVVHVDALAASAASIIAMAGDKVVMTTASMMMIHDASMGAYGNADYLRDSAEILDKLSQNGAKVYALKTGESAEFCRTLMRQETWFDAEEAVEAGFADEVSGETAEEELDKAEQHISNHNFQFKGRGAAPDPLETRRRIANQLGENMAQPTPAAPAPPTPASQTAVEPEPDEVEPANDPAPEGTDPAVEPAPADPQPATPTTPPAEQRVPVQGADGRFTFYVGGQPTSDASAVQSRINMLESFREETMKAARNSFVDQLAGDKKILQPQVPSLKAYALSLTDEGYAAWTATWDGAAALPMLQSSGGNENPDPAQPPAQDASADALEIAKETVKQHKLGGMKPAQIEQTASYLKLKAADPNFDLSTL